jgi:outer membrane protein
MQLEPAGDALATRPFVRVVHGWASPSDLGGILVGQIKFDPHHNQLTSVVYGHPLTDHLFRLPIAVYLTPGLAFHHSSAVQSTSAEGVLAIKAYYEFRWPLRWRIGAGEGLSWINRVTYIERTELEGKGYRPSRLMNFLDFSFDLNAGDLFRHKSLEPWWLGYGIHHRSSIFETSSQFGRIKGGSNYLTLYLQRDL